MNQVTHGQKEMIKMGYSDDMKEFTTEEKKEMTVGAYCSLENDKYLHTVGFRKSFNKLNQNKQNIEKYLNEVFEFEPRVTTIEVHSNMDNDTLRVVINGKKVGHIIGKRGWILKLLADTIKMKFDIKVNFNLKEIED